MATPYGPDVDVAVKVVSYGSPSTENFYLLARIVPTEEFKPNTQNKWKAYVVRFDGNGHLSVGHMECSGDTGAGGGDGSYYLQSPVSCTLAANDIVGIRVEGSTVKAYVNGSLIASWTDTTPLISATSPGFVGLYIPGASGSSPQLDDFKIGTLDGSQTSFPDAACMLVDDFNRSNGAAGKHWQALGWDHSQDGGTSHLTLDPTDLSVSSNKLVNGRYNQVYPSTSGAFSIWVYDACGCFDPNQTWASSVYSHTANPTTGYSDELVIQSVGDSDGVIRMTQILVWDDITKTTSRVIGRANVYVTYFASGADVENDTPLCEALCIVGVVVELENIGADGQQKAHVGASICVPLCGSDNNVALVGTTTTTVEITASACLTDLLGNGITDSQWLAHIVAQMGKV